MSIVIEPEKRLFVDYISEDSATTVNVFIVFIMVKNNFTHFTLTFHSRLENKCFFSYISW